MAREILSDEEVEREIERLRDSHYVRIAQKEQRLKYKRRQYMYCLRSLEKRGKQLAADGVTIENLEYAIAEIELDSTAD